MGVVQFCSRMFLIRVNTLSRVEKNDKFLLIETIVCQIDRGLTMTWRATTEIQ
mgnify:CR=1 FL=1